MLRIREVRRAAGLTMKQLGAMVGVSEGAISHYETGRREPDPLTLGRIANALSVSVDYLLGRDTQTSVPPPPPESIPAFMEGLTPDNRRFIEEIARQLLETQRKHGQ